MSKYLKGAFGWAMYDWAISAFSTTVMAGFFPIFFKDFWSKGAEPSQSTFWLGVSVSVASLVVSVMAPILGAMADHGGTKKRSLLIFTILGVACTGALYFVAEGEWLLAAGLYALGVIGSLGAAVFYDSLLMNVSDAGTVHLLSARGFALGYLGGGLLFLVNVLMVQYPASFGIPDAARAVQLSFLSVAVWWGVFTIPLLVTVPESHGSLSLLEAMRVGFASVGRTVRRMDHNLIIFLIAYWLYIDGVDTIVVMAVDYGKSIGFGTGDLISALLLVQFVGFPFSYLLGALAQRWRPKPIILMCISVYLLVTVLGSRLQTEPYSLFGIHINQFYLLAFLIGMVQGGVQSLSRSLYSRLVPPERPAEFFGFYNMLGRFATIVGPVLMGTVTRLTGEPRHGILSIALLFLVGGIILLSVREPVGVREGKTS